MIIANNSLDQKDEKKRHIVLTLLLFLFVVGDMIALKNVTSDILVFDLNFAFVALSVVDLVCSYFLFMWKKWAFWGILNLFLDYIYLESQYWNRPFILFDGTIGNSFIIWSFTTEKTE